MPLTPNQLRTVNEMVRQIEEGKGFGQVIIIIRRDRETLMGMYFTQFVDDPCPSITYPMPEERFPHG